MNDEDAGRLKVMTLVKSMDYAIFTTRSVEGAALHARPMAYRSIEGDAELWFFSKKSSRKAEEIEAQPDVLISFADPRAQHFVSISGRAEIISDRGIVESRWSEIYRAWFPGGPSDENVIAIRVTAEHAEYWDTPTSAMVYAFGYLKAIATGKPHRAGDIGRVDFQPMMPS